MTQTVVAKVGGSLYDLPELAARLREWRTQVPELRVILFPGGGGGADAIRRLDRTHQLGEEAAHRLALRVLGVNAHFLSDLLGIPVVTSALAGLQHPTCVVDPQEFCTEDDRHTGSLPHSWDVTSDSIAARVAATVSGRLILLKSADLPPAMSWREAALANLVDRTFPRIVAEHDLQVDWVNLRQPGPTRRR